MTPGAGDATGTACRRYRGQSRAAPAATPEPYRRFTLLEMMVVLVIITLALALAMPRIGRLPSGLLVRSAASHVRAACRQAGTCARATGATVKLTLDPEKNLFRQDASAAPAAPPPMAALPVPAAAIAGGKPGPAQPLPAETEEPPKPSAYAFPREYSLPKGIEWHLENLQAPGEAETPATFTFFASGEAAGTPVEYSVGKRRFRLTVDRLTGRPAITELE